MANRKILYSPGFGAGWSSWAGNREVAKFMLEYTPIIEALERGESLGSDGRFRDGEDRTTWHPAMQQFAADCTTKFGEVPYLGGAGSLEVMEVPEGARVRIHEYDGNESVEVEGAYEGWM